MKTKHNSHRINDIAKGCKYCVKGQKLVLFVGGKCSRKCWYCSLSEGRKNENKAWANERPIITIKDLIEEVKESNAKGAGITGGDPLVYYKDTIKYAKILKKEFGENFHIHIYLPFPLVNKEKLKELHKHIDEVRFHASFLVNEDKLYKKEIEKLKLAAKIFGKQNTGIELPAIPTKKKEILKYIKEIEDIIGFANLNELEISDTNFTQITKEYKMNPDTYTIRKSKKTAKWILRKLKNSKLKIHFCTAKTKNIDQYQNRLKRHKIMPYGHKTNEGTVIYFVIETNRPKTVEKDIKRITKRYYVDKKSKRIILDINTVGKIHSQTNYKIAKIEEHPTFEREIMTKEWVGE